MQDDRKIITPILKDLYPSILPDVGRDEARKFLNHMIHGSTLARERLLFLLDEARRQAIAVTYQSVAPEGGESTTDIVATVMATLEERPLCENFRCISARFGEQGEERPHYVDLQDLDDHMRDRKDGKP